MHPPIARGDLAALVRQQSPGSCLIVDGVFYFRESVSLEEIREATAAGWQIFGTSSMGALRAVEARPLGMRGIGAVYRWLKLFEVEDDDEVAQVVHPDTFEPLSLAMVDVRGLVREVAREEKLTRPQARAVIAAMKALYFPERTRTRLTKELSRVAGRPVILSERPTLKSKDARRALQRLLEGRS